MGDGRGEAERDGGRTSGDGARQRVGGAISQIRAATPIRFSNRLPDQPAQPCSVSHCRRCATPHREKKIEQQREGRGTRERDCVIDAHAHRASSSLTFTIERADRQARAHNIFLRVMLKIK